MHTLLEGKKLFALLSIILKGRGGEGQPRLDRGGWVGGGGGWLQVCLQKPGATVRWSKIVTADSEYCACPSTTELLPIVHFGHRLASSKVVCSDAACHAVATTVSPRCSVRSSRAGGSWSVSAAFQAQQAADILSAARRTAHAPQLSTTSNQGFTNRGGEAYSPKEARQKEGR